MNTPKRFRLTTHHFRCTTLVFEGLLVVVGAFYSFFAYHQWSEMKLDRRAWVAVDGIVGFPEPLHPFPLRITLINTGRTFAKNLQLVAIGTPITAGRLPNFSKETQESERRQDSSNIRNVLLAPNSHCEATIEPGQKGTVLSADDVHALKAGEIQLFVFGRATYNDIFKRSHWLIFCSILTYNPVQAENGGWSYRTYKQYNDTGLGRPPKW